MSPAEDSSTLEDSTEAPKKPLVPQHALGRAPYELALLLASTLAAASATAAVLGGLKAWTSPTLGVLFVIGALESVIAIGLAIRVLLLEEKRLALFVPGAALAAAASASLAGIFLLSGSV